MALKDTVGVDDFATATDGEKDVSLMLKTIHAMTAVSRRYREALHSDLKKASK